MPTRTRAWHPSPLLGRVLPAAVTWTSTAVTGDWRVEPALRGPAGRFAALARGLAAVAVVLAVGLGCTPAPVLTIDDAAIVIRDNDHVLAVGEPKITVVEYVDFQCPACGMFARDTFPTIKRDYIDTGKVRWVLRHFPLTSIHDFAQGAAEAAECAADQNMFWEYAERLFENQSALTDSDLERYAADLGLDAAAFNACRQSGEKSARVGEDRESGEAIGVPGTPSFAIGNRLYAGVFSAASFAVPLDEAIAAAGGD